MTRRAPILHALHEFRMEVVRYEIVTLEPGQVLNRFKRHLGESPIRTLTRIRLKAAAAKLLQGTPIPEAATHYGYGSEAAFNRAFGREFGVTPGRWKRAHKSA